MIQVIFPKTELEVSPFLKADILATVWQWCKINFDMANIQKCVALQVEDAN